MSVPEGFRRVPRRANRQNRRRLDTLQRMLRRAEEGLEDGLFAYKDANRLAAEIAALRWAVQVAEAWVDEDPLFDVEWRSDFTDSATLQDILDMLGTAVIYRGAAHEVLEVEFVRRDEPGQTVRLALRALGESDEPQRAATRHFVVMEKPDDR